MIMYSTRKVTHVMLGLAWLEAYSFSLHEPICSQPELHVDKNVDNVLQRNLKEEITLKGPKPKNNQGLALTLSLYETVYT
jgi:hypothetical protein